MATVKAGTPRFLGGALGAVLVGPLLPTVLARWKKPYSDGCFLSQRFVSLARRIPS